MYKPRSVRRAQEAKELQRNLGYPSAKTMPRMMNKSAVKDCPIRAGDLRNAIKKDGRLPEEVRGKTVRRAIDTASELVTDLPDNPELKAYSDIMIMRDECKFLVTVLKHADPNAGRLDLTLVQPLTRVNAQEIGAAMQDEMDVVATRGYAIRTREVDLQLYTGELKNKFRGVAFEVVGAGDHVPVAENKVKTIKERCRCIGAGLTWAIPNMLLPDLVRYVVTRLNDEVQDGEEFSPRYKFCGRLPNFKTDYALRFGKYAEVFNKSETGTKNSIDLPRTYPAIALRPLGNLNGTWEFIRLDNMRRVKRSQWIDMPDNELVVATMRELAERDIDWERMIDFFSPEEEDPPADSAPAPASPAEGEDVDERVPDLVSEDTDDDDEPPDDLRDCVYDNPTEDIRLQDLSDNESVEGEQHGDAASAQGAETVRRSARIRARGRARWLSGGQRATMMSIEAATKSHGAASNFEGAASNVGQGRAPARARG